MVKMKYITSLNLKWPAIKVATWKKKVCFYFGTSFEMISPFYNKIFNQMNQILFIFDSSHCTDPVSHWLWLLHRITTAALATGWHLVSPRYQW